MCFVDIYMEVCVLKRLGLFVVFGVLLLVVGLVVVTRYTVFNFDESKQFYVGVTYCGSSIQEAKELVDRVRGYTNLFVLQSGAFMGDVVAMEEIGDYAVASNLSYAVYSSDKVDYYDDRGHYYGVNIGGEVNEWANAAKERWGEQFIGVYYRDEPGGDVLAGKFVTLEKVNTQTDGLPASTAKVTKFEDSITVYSEGNLRVNKTFSSIITYQNNGVIQIRNSFNENGTIYPITNRYSSFSTNTNLREVYLESFNYYPNGTVTIREYITNSRGNFYTTENITQYLWPTPSYETLLKQNPIQNNDDAARVFVDMNKDFFEDINKKQLNNEDILIFTADYGLYWWDYQSGYDLVLAELAWNHSITQEIALVRGAANLQEKSWGTMLTWKYTHPPYLPEGEEMFECMEISYRAGAEYVVVFNYSEDPKNPNTLQEEHFLAIERFWNEIVQNPKITHGKIKAEAVLVLPQNYGGGMHSSQESVWGIWPSDSTSQEIYDQIQSKIVQYGLKLDIVFEDSNYLVMGKYSNIYYLG